VCEDASKSAGGVEKQATFVLQGLDTGTTDKKGERSQAVAEQ
jgi:hypothetical protein